MGVAGYEIYRDGGAAPLATVGRDTLSYADATVAPSTAYSYTVRARDAAGNASPASTPATVTTPAEGTGTTQTIAADADAYVDAGAPSTPSGTSSRLLVDGSPVRHGYLRFTVGGGPGTVQRATLRVYATDGTDNGPQVYATGTGWTEAGLTWATRPAPSGTASDNKGANGGRFRHRPLDGTVPARYYCPPGQYHKRQHPTRRTDGKRLVAGVGHARGSEQGRADSRVPPRRRPQSR